MTTYEVCPHCDDGNEYEITNNGIVQCKTCNKDILLCSVCGWEYNHKRCATCTCKESEWCKYE
jgi:uncharacterized protein (DUF983 family)